MKTNLTKSWRNDFLIYTSFLTTTRKSLFVYKFIIAKRCSSSFSKFNESSLPEKEYFNRHLNTEDITDADYAHAKRVCKDFETKRFRRLSWLISPK